MTRTFGKFSVLVIGVIAVLFMAMCITSCHNSETEKSAEQEDSVWFSVHLMAQTNPEFTKIDELKTFHDNLVLDDEIKDVFKQMSPQMVDRVGRVVLSREHKVTMKSLVSEYKLNYDIYSRQIETDEHAPVIPKELNKDTTMSINLINEEESKCEH